jgi:hypothetical protein
MSLPAPLYGDYMTDILDKEKVAIPAPAKRPKSKLQRAWAFFTRRVIGLNPKIFLSYRHLPRYFADSSKFKKAGGQIFQHMPILSESDEQAGTASGQYFHQDLLVASLIYKNQPKRHVDVGSSVTGFVAHVASFRPIEVMDIRPLEAAGHENIVFFQANLMNEDSKLNGISDSVSCLHTIEHFGLGRYGDPIDPEGYLKGFRNLVNMVQDGGRLYISFPISQSTQVWFNAHRYFHPRAIFTWPGSEQLEFQRFDYVDDAGDFHPQFPVQDELPPVQRGCGIYTFVKKAS